MNVSWNRRAFRVLLAVASCCAFTGAVGRAQTSYVYTVIADVTNCYGLGTPAINNKGEVAFGGRCAQPVGTPGGDFVIRRGDGGALTPIFTSSATYPAANVDVISINDSGTVAFSVNGSCGFNTAILTGDGGPLQTVVDRCVNPGPKEVHRPSISNTGAVAFGLRSASSNSFDSVVLARNGALVTIAGPGTSAAGIGPLSMAYEPSINNNDVVTFMGNRADTGAGILFTGAGAALTTIAIDSLGSFNGINDRGRVAFLANPGAIRKGDGGPVTSIAARTFEGGRYQSFDGGGASINAVGKVAFLASLPSGVRGVFTGADPEADVVLQTGRSLHDSNGVLLGTVTGVSILREAINDSGQVAMMVAYNDDGASKVAIIRAGPPMVRYLAEGATTGFFDTRLALLNPDDTDMIATITFARGAGAPITTQLAVPARRRVTLDPKTIPDMTQAEFSTRIESDRPLVVDRTMSWNVQSGYGAHAETAVAAPALTWYLAEGSTVGGFNLFYLLQNPSTSDAQVRVRYLRPTGAPLEKTLTLRPTSRTNIWVNVEEFPGLGRALAASDVSAVIEVTNDQPIIVERAMYLDVPGETFGAGHESAGVTAAATEWFLAEGATGPFFDLFALIANPGNTDAQIEASYLLPDGTVLVLPYVVAANSRFTIWVDLEHPALANTAVSTIIRSLNGVPIIVERAMWWPGDGWYEAHNSPGATTTGTKWALAEGEVGGTRDVDTYILLANTSPAEGIVKVTLLFEDGTSAERTFTVTARSRFNVDARSEFPSAMNKRFGAIVESQGTTPVQLVVERAMYWNARGKSWAAGTNALATRLSDP